LFRVTRNVEIRETDLLRKLRDALASALPSSWSISRLEEKRGSKRVAAMALTAPDGSTRTVLVEVKRTAEPRDVAAALRQFAPAQRSPDETVMLVAPYLSPRARELLQEGGAGWFDATGNLRLQLDRPAVFINVAGASRNPFTDSEDRRLKSLKGPGAARVVRALLDETLPLGVRALADAADVGLATSSRVTVLLVREELINRDQGGRISAVNKRALVRRWTADYGINSSNQAVPMLGSRGIDKVLTSLQRYHGDYAITAEAAARRYLPSETAAVAPLALLTLFVPDATTAADALSLRGAPRGANVVLVEPFDSVVFRRTTQQEGLVYAAPSQVVADLLTGTARGPEQADALLDALAANDRAWAR
jgi:hypothetical protein